MNLNNITDNIFIINLLRRKDRLFHIQKQSLKFNFDALVMAAVDADDLENTTNLRSGELALLLSHRQILIYAKFHKLDKIIVLEDDCEFVENTNERLEAEWAEVPEDADIVYLGYDQNYLGAGSIPAEPISENIIRLYTASPTHAMVISSSVYDAVLSKIDLLDSPLDIIYGDIQREYKVYGFDKSLAKQYYSYSDIKTV